MPFAPFPFTAKHSSRPRTPGSGWALGGEQSSGRWGGWGGGGGHSLTLGHWASVYGDQTLSMGHSGLLPSPDQEQTVCTSCITHTPHVRNQQLSMSPRLHTGVRVPAQGAVCKQTGTQCPPAAAWKTGGRGVPKTGPGLSSPQRGSPPPWPTQERDLQQDSPVPSARGGRPALVWGSGEQDPEGSPALRVSHLTLRSNPGLY